MRQSHIAISVICISLVVAGIIAAAYYANSGNERTPVGEPAVRKRLLFVCIENSNRSQMAEAFARMHGGDKVEAASAGSRPSGKVNPRAIEFMREVGYDLSKHSSKSIDEFNNQVIDVAVTMGCGDACPLVKAKRREDWQIPDPKHLSPDEYRNVRNLIERKVKELLNSL